jgi:hypothetical protein
MSCCPSRRQNFAMETVAFAGNVQSLIFASTMTFLGHAS